jgi:hypothetical protein
MRTGFAGRFLQTLSPTDRVLSQSGTPTWIATVRKDENIRVWEGRERFTAFGH